MNYLELSEKSTREESRKLAQKIENSFTPEIVIFVAKGAYYIGDEIAKYFNVPLIEVKAERQKGNLKKIIAPLLKIIPSLIKKVLREFEVKSNTHKKNSERKVTFEEKDLKELLKYKRVLLVDDSIDTGNTIKQIVDYLKKYELEIKVAGINVFSMSEEVIKLDYYNYKDTLLNGPWSNDSKYYKKFIGDYNFFKEGRN